MCYGSGCEYECKSYGPNMGECRKPSRAVCPQDIHKCEICEEEFDHELEENLCADCFKDEQDDKRS